MFISLYRGLIQSLYPIAIKPYIAHRKKIGKEDKERFNERIGESQLTRPDGKLVWFHGASVGESISMLPLIERLLQSNKELHIMVTTGTVTSAEIMKKRLPPRAFHQYFPIDNPKFSKKFIEHWHPDAILWFESDFWPSMLSEIKRHNIPLLLVNGRISNRSFARWQKFPFIIKEILDCFTYCLGQSEEDARRLQILGAKASGCLGNIKYAGLPLPYKEESLQTIKESIGARPVWLISSTHNDEELQLGRHIAQLKAQIPNILTLIAPRHPHRGQEIQQALTEMGLNVSLRSKQEAISPQTDVYIADTIGEMGLWYHLCPIVFIGGSLIPHGGQNFMEPSRMKDIVIAGPHMHNFTDAINRALKADAIIQVKDSQEVIDSVLKLLSNKSYLDKKRQQAYEWAQSENKVLEGIIEKIQEYIKA